jgi:hypothetical protein
MIRAGSAYRLALGQDGSIVEGGGEILCPACDARELAYVHLQEPVYHADEFTCPTGERGAWIDVPMWCEQGHHFNLVLAFHEGCSYLHVVPGHPVLATEPLSRHVGVQS